MAILSTSRLNETFDLLTHPRRRYVIYHLTSESETVTIEHLATEIAKWEGSYAGTGPSGTAKNIEVNLHHMHLPKLADAGVVTLDTNADYVELGDADGVSDFLTNAARIDDWSHAAADD